MAPDWVPPGYAPDVLIRQTRQGPVWRAVELSGGRVVELCRLSDELTGQTVDLIRARIERLSGVACAHLQAPRAVLSGAQGLVLLSDHVDGGAAGRAQLTPAARADLAAGYATALTALEDAGLVHAGPHPDDLLITSEGRALLSGLEEPPEGERGAADARASLAGLLAGWGAVVPPDRPEAGRAGGATRRTVGRRTAVLAGSGLALTIVVGAAAWPAPPRPQRPDWSAVLDHLDALRAEAFARADPRLLDDVYAARSPAGAADRAAIADLARSGRSVRGLRHRLVSLTVLDVETGRVRLVAALALLPHALLAGDTRIVERVGGGGAASFTFELLRRGPAWRIGSVAEAPG